MVNPLLSKTNLDIFLKIVKPNNKYFENGWKKIINAIKNFDLQILFIFASGCIVGLIIFSRVLSYLFKNFKNEILSLLSGFLFGSLIKIWPFRNVLESRINSEGELEAVVTRPELPNLENVDQILFFIIFTIAGYVLINFLQKKSFEDNKE